MATTPTIAPPRNAKELAALIDVLTPIFNMQSEHAQRYGKHVGTRNFRVIHHGKEVAGGLALIKFGQYFGGRSVPMMGVAAVGVAPHHRSRGLASSLMQQVVRQMHAQGIAISTLYPATLPLYQRVGYQQAGGRYEVRIALKPLRFDRRGISADGAALEVRPITPQDAPAIAKCYHARAMHTPGHLDRVEFSWHRVYTPRGQKTQGFLVYNPSARRVEAYTCFLQKEAVDAPYTLNLTDLVALTPPAGRAILSCLSDHRSMADVAIFPGSPDDPILKLLPERNYSAKLLDHWMVRIVDVRKALEARGYPAGLAAELVLDVHDDLLPQNAGRFVLTVKDGKGTARASKGGSSSGIPSLRIDVRGLAGLYTGHMSPWDLTLTGLAEPIGPARTADDTQAVAAAVFAGANPWMTDGF